VLAETCASLLRNARPLHTIFGPYYRPETVVEQRIRSLLPSPTRPKDTSPPTGIRMKRQQYYTNPSVREELMRAVCLTTAGSIKAISPDQHVREKRRQTIAKVESSIRNHFGQEFRIETFGSTQYGVDGPTSDLDLVVIVGIFLMSHLRGSERATGPRKDVGIRP
jgi:hypothetical protein